ncbi:hypothetical protein O181_028252 [Austropuccinia psidii MF-1]|uniref:Uncharacterized protein n=1 Tax=Austropuccinia psidii MF-1 TaxID=1389203 RepID=A0A9Q3CU76_9BASI|nr:hypothetical protein [Austropuccinia psidii MF-1]
MSPVHLRNLGIPRNHPEDRQRLFRTRRLTTGHLGHNGGWQDTEGNHTNSSIHLPIQHNPQTKGLEGYGSSSSAPINPQRSIPMEHGKQEAQPSITLKRNWSKLPEDMSQRDTLSRSYVNHQRMECQQEVKTPGEEGNQDKGKSSHYPSYRTTIEPERAYFDSSRLTRSRPTQISSGFAPFRNSRLVAKSHHYSQSQVVSRRRQGYKGKKRPISGTGRRSQNQ